MSAVKVAIVGSGNIGTDLMLKIMRRGDPLQVAAVIGVDPESDGLKRASDHGVAISSDGIEGLRALPDYGNIAIVMDATSASAHMAHAPVLQADGKRVIDLTPAAIGPYVIPVVNQNDHEDADNTNMVTCGGQATVPIVAAVASATDRVIYGEIVAAVASKSAGPGTRANIDEFTETTSEAIRVVGGAEASKAIIILNPAEPPVLMRDSVFTLSQGGSRDAIERAVHAMVAQVQTYVPGYRLKQDVQFEDISPDAPLEIPGKGPSHGLLTSVFLEVEGAADYLPAYAGNLDIMTSAAVSVAERIAHSLTQNEVA